MRKRGVSEIVSWVLLVGLTITIGMVVSQWLREHAEITTDKLADQTQADLICNDVAINAYFTDPSTCASVTLVNKGYHTIHEINARSKYGTNPYTIDLKPGDPPTTQPLNTGNTSVDIIPVVVVKGATIGCPTQQIKL